MNKPGITLIIEYPSKEIGDNETYEGAKFYFRGAVHSLVDIREIVPPLVLPDRVIKLITESLKENYRVQLLDGVIQYKVYKKPPRDLVPQEQDGTKLEEFQKIEQAPDYATRLERLQHKLRCEVCTYSKAMDQPRTKNGQRYCINCGVPELETCEHCLHEKPQGIVECKIAGCLWPNIQQGSGRPQTIRSTEESHEDNATKDELS